MGILGLVILAKFFYKIGRMSVSEPIAKDLHKIESTINKIEIGKYSLFTQIIAIKSRYIKAILFLIAFLVIL